MCVFLFHHSVSLLNFILYNIGVYLFIDCKSALRCIRYIYMRRTWGIYRGDLRKISHLQFIHIPTYLKRILGTEMYEFQNVYASILNFWIQNFNFKLNVLYIIISIMYELVNEFILDSKELRLSVFFFFMAIYYTHFFE